MLLRTLGGLELEGNSFTRPKPLLLLAYLALEGAQPRRRLEELIWPRGKDPADSLSTTVRRLNAIQGDLIRSEDDRLASRAACDATALLQALDEGQDTDAIAAYAGPFLDGLTLDLGEELEEWVLLTREHLAARVQRVHLDRAERALSLTEKTGNIEHRFSAAPCWCWQRPH